MCRTPPPPTPHHPNQLLLFQHPTSFPVFLLGQAGLMKWKQTKKKPNFLHWARTLKSSFMALGVNQMLCMWTNICSVAQTKDCSLWKDWWLLPELEPLISEQVEDEWDQARFLWERGATAGSGWHAWQNEGGIKETSLSTDGYTPAYSFYPWVVARHWQQADRQPSGPWVSLSLNSRFCHGCAAFGQFYLISNLYSKASGVGNPKPQLVKLPWGWDPGCFTSLSCSFLTCKWWFKYSFNKYLLSICYMPSTVIEMGSVVTK